MNQEIEVLHNPHKSQTEVRYNHRVVGVYADMLTPAEVADWWHHFLTQERVPVPSGVTFDVPIR